MSRAERLRRWSRSRRHRTQGPRSGGTGVFRYVSGFPLFTPAYVVVAVSLRAGTMLGLPLMASARTPTDNTAAPTFAPAHGATVTDAGASITLTFAGAIRKDGSGADFTGHANLAAILTVIVLLAFVFAAALP